MKGPMTPNKVFSMFNSGEFNDKLEDWIVSCVVSKKGEIEHERMLAWATFNPEENKNKLTSSLKDKFSQKATTKIKTQVR